MLSTDEIHQFERDGFVGPFTIPPDVFAEFGEAFQSRIAHVLLGEQRSKMSTFIFRNQHVHSRSVYRLITIDPILSRVQSLLGPDVLAWTAHVIARNHGHNGQRWHSDSINQFIRGIHVSIALTDMNRKNGCLRLIPKSHLYRASLTRHPKIKGGADPTAYADSVAPWNAPHSVIEMELEPGQFFLTWGGLWHSVGVNESGKLRMAAVARFARTDFCVRDYGYDDSMIQHGKRLPCVVVSGTDTFHLNRTEPPPTGDIYVQPLDLPSRLRWLGKNVRDRAADLATQLVGARAKYNA